MIYMHRYRPSMTSSIREDLRLKEKEVNQWKPFVQAIVNSKVCEFKQLGYFEATDEEVWKCLETQVWKGNPKKRLHEITQDIFRLKPYIFMNYLTMKAYQNDDLEASVAALMKNEIST